MSISTTNWKNGWFTGKAGEIRSPKLVCHECGHVICLARISARVRFATVPPLR